MATKRDPETETMGSEDASSSINTRLEFTKIQDWHNVGEVDTRIRSDRQVPLITGCCAMKKGTVVLCDYNNSKIKLLDETNDLKSDIPCESSPFDVAPVRDDKAVVSFPQSRSLKFLKVEPGLKLEGYIGMNYKCYGVAVNENAIFVCIDETNSNPRVRGIQILSQNGNMLQFIKHLGDGMPKYLCVSHNGNLIFYSSTVVNDNQIRNNQKLRDAFVLCVTKGEHVLYRYSDECLYNPGSLVGDDIGSLLICDQQFCSVHIVKSSGSHGETLHFSHPNSYKLNPTSMCYNRNGDVLLVAVTVGRPPMLPRPIVQLERLAWTKDRSKILFFKLQSEKRSWWARWNPGALLQWSGAVLIGLLFMRLFRKTSE